MSYSLVHVKMTKPQTDKVLKAMKEKTSLKVKLNHSALYGSDSDRPLMLTKTQVAKIEKAKRAGKGADLILSPSQLKSSYGVSETLGYGWASILGALAPMAIDAISGLIKKKGKGMNENLAKIEGGCADCPYCNGSGILADIANVLEKPFVKKRQPPPRPGPPRMGPPRMPPKGRGISAKKIVAPRAPPMRLPEYTGPAPQQMRMPEYSGPIYRGPTDQNRPPKKKIPMQGGNGFESGPGQLF